MSTITITFVNNADISGIAKTSIARQAITVGKSTMSVATAMNATAMKKPDPIVSEYMSELGRRGGRSKSAKKAESSRKNLEKGRAARKPKTEER